MRWSPAPRLAAVVGASGGSIAALILVLFVSLDARGVLAFTLQGGHLNAAMALGSVLAGITLSGRRAFLAGHASYVGSFTVFLPLLLRLASSQVGWDRVGLYVAVLVSLAAVWSIVALLLSVGTAWLERWAERRLAGTEKTAP